MLGISARPPTASCRTLRCGPSSLLPSHCIPAAVAISLSRNCPKSAWLRASAGFSAWNLRHPRHPARFSPSIHMAAILPSFWFQLSPPQRSLPCTKRPPSSLTLLHNPILFSSRSCEWPYLFTCLHSHSLFPLSGLTALRTWYFPCLPSHPASRTMPNTWEASVFVDSHTPRSHSGHGLLESKGQKFLQEKYPGKEFLRPCKRPLVPSVDTRPSIQKELLRSFFPSLLPFPSFPFPFFPSFLPLFFSLTT